MFKLNLGSILKMFQKLIKLQIEEICQRISGLGLKQRVIKTLSEKCLEHIFSDRYLKGF